MGWYYAAQTEKRQETGTCHTDTDSSGWSWLADYTLSAHFHGVRRQRLRGQRHQGDQHLDGG